MTEGFRRMRLMLRPALLLGLLVIAQVVDRVEVEILAIMVVAHHRLRVPVAAHHLHLAVGQALVERARDGRPSQVYIFRKVAGCFRISC
jgi:hypothetical protein